MREVIEWTDTYKNSRRVILRWGDTIHIHCTYVSMGYFWWFFSSSRSSLSDTLAGASTAVAVCGINTCHYVQLHSREAWVRLCVSKSPAQSPDAGFNFCSVTQRTGRRAERGCDCQKRDLVPQLVCVYVCMCECEYTQLNIICKYIFKCACRNTEHAHLSRRATQCGSWRMAHTSIVCWLLKPNVRQRGGREDVEGGKGAEWLVGKS